MSLLVMFPGQGSQRVGMGKALLQDFPQGLRTFEEAGDTLHQDIKELCFEGPADRLQLTANQQPALLTVSIAMWRILTAEAEVKPSLFAGHSLGEFSALVAGGWLDFADGLRLVRARGDAMQRAVPEGQGSMAAVLGLQADLLEKVCAEVRTSVGMCVEVVNFNSPEQQIISGHAPAVSQVCKSLQKLTPSQPARRIRSIPLKVSAPFHSSLMKPAREAMAPLLEHTHLCEPSGRRMLANVTGKVTPSYTSDLLVQQIDQPVLWMQSMQSAVQAGMRACLEVGPGKVLTELARRCLTEPTQGELPLIHPGTDRMQSCLSGLLA